MPSYCQRIFNAAATTQLLQDSEGTGHTFAMHLLPSDDREGFLRRRLAAPPAPGTPAPEAVCGFLSRNDIVDVVQALLNSDRGQWMLGMMDDGGLAGHVCEKATALGLPRRISFAGITRNANRLQEEYVVEELAQVQLYARRWAPPSPIAPPFYVVTCFPTKRAPNMGIDDWGDDRIIGSSLFQQFHDVQHVQDNTNEGLRQRAEAYALWLQNNLANVRAANDGSRFAVAKVIPGPSTQARPMKPYYQAQPQLRAPVGLNTLTLAMTAQGYNVVEETHGASVYLMVMDR